MIPSSQALIQTICCILLYIFVQSDQTVALTGIQQKRSTALDEVESTVHRVYEHHNLNIYDDCNVLDLDPKDRESMGVAIRLQKRLSALERNGDCRRCWFQRKHCVCDEIDSQPSISLDSLQIRRIFLYMHHKEVGLAVDTSKYILAAYPDVCKLVVNGISEEFQPAMKEMMEAAMTEQCLVLFPSDDASTFKKIHSENINVLQECRYEEREGLNIIVIDGTWSQAQKMHGRLPNNATRVCLSEEAISTLSDSVSVCYESDSKSNVVKSTGHQLRRHPITWKQVSTLEAVRLLLRDISNVYKIDHESQESSLPWNVLRSCQQIGDTAAKKQLGPPRIKNKV